MTALDQRVLDVLPRRVFLGHVAFAPVVGFASASFLAERADAATRAIIVQIDQAERRCADTKRAFEDAILAFEASIPRPHWSIDFSDQARALCNRWASDSWRFGRAVPRYAPTVETLQRDLYDRDREDPASHDRNRKLIRRLERRLRQRQARIAEAEKAHNLDELDRLRVKAQQELTVLSDAVFERPATTLAAIQLQARTLCAYTTASTEQCVNYKTGRYGAQLAANLQALAEAT